MSVTTESLTVSTTAVSLASVPSSGEVGDVCIQAQGFGVRVDFGEDPTSTSGLLLDSGKSMYVTKQQAFSAKFILDVDAGGDATIFAIYY